MILVMIMVRPHLPVQAAITSERLPIFLPVPQVSSQQLLSLYHLHGLLQLHSYHFYCSRTLNRSALLATYFDLGFVLHSCTDPEKVFLKRAMAISKDLMSMNAEGEKEPTILATNPSTSRTVQSYIILTQSLRVTFLSI